MNRTPTRAQRRDLARRQPVVDDHRPRADAPIPDWTQDEAGRIHSVRSATYWRRLPGQSIHCDLCYRRCELGPGEAGWCGLRVNQGGTLALTSHGVVSCAVRQQRGYQVDPFLLYKPGALSLFLGGVNCTAGCVFCMSKELTWRPERVPWAFGGERRLGRSGGWYGYRAMLHPAGAVALAAQWGCQQVAFGINEPTLTWEYTADVARLARRAGLDVLIETNGFTTLPAIHALAPAVSAVDLGIKGSGAPDFYAHWMKSPAAMPAVLAAATAWRQAGVWLLIGDVIAPPQMQTDAAAAEAQRRLYGWIAEHLGPHTPVLITPMMVPGPQRPGQASRWDGFLLSAQTGAADYHAYYDRQARARELAVAAGLVYVHSKRDDEGIRCHACGGLLLRFQSPMLACTPCTMATHGCHYWTHEQHVTDGRCDHCQAAVPIVTLSDGDLAAMRAHVVPLSQRAEAIRLPMAGGTF